MRNNNERPVCHRAEDLVTHLYGEASEAESRDFAGHLQQCDACRAEFGVFNQVHESILLWRNEALGSSFNPAAALSENAVATTQFVQHERKLSALAALREFFTVSPLWLRTATAFAALLLCVLGVLAISRSWNRPAQVAGNDNGPKYTQQQLDEAVKRAQLDTQQTATTVVEKPAPQSKDNGTRVALNRIQPKAQRPKGLSRAEREQLAADLRLIPGSEDEPALGLSDEPEQ